VAGRSRAPSALSRTKSGSGIELRAHRDLTARIADLDAVAWNTSTRPRGSSLVKTGIVVVPNRRYPPAADALELADDVGTSITDLSLEVVASSN
jgi:hypothetical protein